MKNIIITTTLIITAFILGRASIKQTSKTTYTKGKELVSNAQISLPVRELTPLHPILPYKYIFIDNTQTEVVDTARIISDYIAEKTYSLTLFDNMHGKLDITPTIQYNKLSALPFTFTPIEKTVFTKQKWTLFSTLSYNTFHIAGIGGGVFYKNIGLHYKYLWHTELRKNGHEVGIGVLF